MKENGGGRDIGREMGYDKVGKAEIQPSERVSGLYGFILYIQ